jgi:ribosomal protein S12 methylthiotransferase
LKIASGCDRRCAFCAIPSFRGSFVSRPRAEVVAEAEWLAAGGVRELVLVSENSTSYGKDLADPRALELLLADLGDVAGIERIRVSYLQPAEVRADLVRAMLDAPRVADYFDLSFQHASAPLLRRMRRFGGTDSFLELITSIRAGSPDAGVRSNVIVGFPGETEADLEELMVFLGSAQMDAVGVFGYSDEDGTEAIGLDGKLDDAEIRARVSEVSDLVDEVMAQRAEQRMGQEVEVLVEHVPAPHPARSRVRRPPARRGRGVLDAALVGRRGVRGRRRHRPAVVAYVIMAAAVLVTVVTGVQYTVAIVTAARRHRTRTADPRP